MNITEINNIYALIAVLTIAFLASSIIIILLFFIKKRGLKIKKGDTEIDIGEENQPEETPEIENAPAITEKLTDTETASVPPSSSCMTKTLTEHPFFSEMIRWEKRDIARLPIKSEKKKLIVVSFLKIKFRVFREMLREYVINAEMLMNVGHAFKCDDIQQLFWDGIDRYNDEARKCEIKRNDRIMTGIPEMFIEKFDKWHTPHIDMINDAIRQIVNNEIYPDEYVKLLAIIEVFYLAFKLTILDAVGSINELNGELERLLEEKLGA